MRGYVFEFFVLFFLFVVCVRRRSGLLAHEPPQKKRKFFCMKSIATRNDVRNRLKLCGLRFCGFPT